jgi:hypothetical protein
MHPVVVQDLALPARHGVAEGAGLGDRVASAGGDGVVAGRGRFVGIIDEVDAAHCSLGQPRAEHLVMSGRRAARRPSSCPGTRSGRSSPLRTGFDVREVGPDDHCSCA